MIYRLAELSDWEDDLAIRGGALGLRRICRLVSALDALYELRAVDF